MKYQNIIFDLDGTLIDTEEAVLKTWQYTLQEYGFSYPLSDLQIVLGVTEQAGLQALGLCPDVGFSDEWIRNYALFGKTTRYFSGVEEMLERLKRSGHTVGVVTSRYRSECDLFFTRLRFDGYFDLLICADDTERHKPYPDPLEKYMSRMNIRPQNCIYIGDMPTDIRCAKAAKAASGHAVWGKSDQRLAEDADFVFRHPSEICEKV